MDESQRFKGPIDCLKQTWKHEGFRGLYRGLPAPVAGSMVESAALFLSYSYFQNLIRIYQPTPSPQLSIPQLGLAAAGAGFVTSFILFVRFAHSPHISLISRAGVQSSSSSVRCKSS
jgi:ornithine carrier protein